MLESGELGSKRSIEQKQPHGESKLEPQDEESEAPVSDASPPAAYAHLLNAVFGGPASFIVNGDMLQDCVPDVAPVGWCNPYQWLDDARAEQYSHESVSDGGRHFYLSRRGRFGLRLTPTILYDRCPFGTSQAWNATPKPDWPISLQSQLFPV